MLIHVSHMALVTIATSEFEILVVIFLRKGKTRKEKEEEEAPRIHPWGKTASHGLLIAETRIDSTPLMSTC